MDKQQYTGRCHCGLIRFSFFSEPIVDCRRCNCSFCIRRGAILSTRYYSIEEFNPHKSQEDFLIYRWNDRVVDHLVCRVCGIFPYFSAGEYGFRVNLGCVEQIYALALPTKIIDGRSLSLNAQPGPHPNL